MTHANKLNWNDFASIGQGPIFGVRQTDADGVGMFIKDTLQDHQHAAPQYGILPSAVSAGFDERQLHFYRSEFLAGRGYGINVPYPYPNTGTSNVYAIPVSGKHERTDDTFTSDDTEGISWWTASGIVGTRPPDDMVPVDAVEQTGVLHYYGAVGRFSSAIFTNQITDFAIFNPYVHHETFRGKPIYIPYVSSYRVSSPHLAYSDESWLATDSTVVLDD